MLGGIGWVKIHRKISDNPVYSNANMLKLWIHCLLKASHKEHTQLVGNQMIDLKPGEFVTGREALANEFNSGVKVSERVSAITLWRWLNNFESWGMLNIKKTTKYSVISISNWVEHQQDEQQMNNKRTTNEQQMNTNKNVKNVKNEERPQKQVYDDGSDYMILANFFYEEIRKNNPGHRKPNFQSWSDDIRKMIELDKRDKKEIAQLMRWVQQDEFEMANVLSANKLRKRYDQLILKMRKDKGVLVGQPNAKYQDLGEREY